MFIGIYQIFASMGSTLRLTFPKDVEALLRSVRVLVNMDIFGLPGLTCLTDGSYYRKFWAGLMLPGGMLTVVFLIYFVRTKKARKIELRLLEDKALEEARKHAPPAPTGEDPNEWIKNPDWRPEPEMTEEEVHEAASIHVKHWQHLNRKVKAANEEEWVIKNGMRTHRKDDGGKHEALQKELEDHDNHDHDGHAEPDMIALRVEALMIKSKHYAAAVDRAFLIIFLSYPAMTNTIFGLFICYDARESELRDGTEVEDVSWLANDFEIACTDYLYAFHITVASVLVLVIPVGIPIFMCVMLWRHRKDIAEHHGPHHLEGLYSPYRPECCMWETYMMLEKATLIGLLTFVDRGSVLQALIGVSVSNSMLLAVARATPYVSTKTNVLAIFGQAMIMVAYYSSILLRIDLDGEMFNKADVGSVILWANVPMLLYFLIDTYRTMRDTMHQSRIDLLRKELGGAGAEYRCVAPHGVDTSATMRKLKPKLDHIAHGEIIRVTSQAIDFHSGGAIGRLQTAKKGWCSYNHHGALGHRYFVLVSTPDKQGAHVGSISMKVQQSGTSVHCTVFKTELLEAVKVDMAESERALAVELNGYTLSNLQKRAKDNVRRERRERIVPIQERINEEDVDNATDRDDPKKELVEIICKSEVRGKVDHDTEIGQVYIEVTVNEVHQRTGAVPFKTISGAEFNADTGETLGYELSQDEWGDAALETIVVKAHFIRSNEEDDGMNHPVGLANVQLDEYLEQDEWEAEWTGPDALAVRAELGDVNSVATIENKGPRPDHPDSHVAEANVEHEKSQRDESPGTPVVEDSTTPRGPVTQRNPLFSAPQPEDEIALD